MNRSIKNSPPKILVALDCDNFTRFEALVGQLDPTKCRLKIGKELFTLFGPKVVEYVQSRGFEVFLDLKFHDIPNTVASALKSAANLGVWMVNVHASGGVRMMEAAREALVEFQQKPYLIAVTVLTSMSQSDLDELGVARPLPEQVRYLADLAKRSGLDGVVCSAREAVDLKASLGNDFILVTPGIRLLGERADDQSRIVTPEEAIRNGSDYLVIGRSITQSDNPAAVCAQIHAMIEAI